MRRRTYLTVLGGAVAATVLFDGRGGSGASAQGRGVEQPTATASTPSDEPLRVGIYVTEALARTARDTGYWSVVRPAERVARQLRFSTDLVAPRVVDEPVTISERENHQQTWRAWRESGARGDHAAALLLTTTRDGEYDGYGGSEYAVAEAEDLVYYEGRPQETGSRNEPFVHTLAVACHEVGHALGLSHDDHAAVTLSNGDHYVTLMGVGAPGVEYNGIVLQYSDTAARRLLRRQ